VPKSTYASVHVKAITVAIDQNGDPHRDYFLDKPL